MDRRAWMQPCVTERVRLDFRCGQELGRLSSEFEVEINLSSFWGGRARSSSASSASAEVWMEGVLGKGHGRVGDVGTGTGGRVGGEISKYVDGAGLGMGRSVVDVVVVVIVIVDINTAV